MAGTLFRTGFVVRFLMPCLAALGMVLITGAAALLTGSTGPWKEADEGLLVGEFESTFDDTPYAITVVKIDPRNYSFRLLCASEYGKEKLTAREWTAKHHLAAAINAGMFQEDGFTSVGFMKNFNHVNNPRVSRANSVLAFNPTEENIPSVQLIDRECQNFNELRPKYQSFVQSIRMISCEQQNVWSQQNAKWNTAAVGMDTDGNILFLFGRTAHSVHDFVEILLSLPLSLKGAMYLEGGSQASLYLATPKMTVERNGVWDGFEENNSLQFALPIPNVIGIAKKQPAKG